MTHGAALAREPGVDLAAVWGRDAAKAAAVAAELGTRAYPDFAAFLRQVDAVAFAVPPDVQAALAVQAAEAGKHLLLEKPIATSAADADRLVHAVEAAGVSSVVFVTAFFAESSRDWLASVQASEWNGGWARWISASLGAGSPYAPSLWRQQKGALWDVGPHALSLLSAALGTVVGVSADRGAGDLVHLVFHHASGATSTASLTLTAPEPAVNIELSLWGHAGLSTMPRSQDSMAAAAFGVAVRELVANATAGQPSHRCDVRLGAEVVKILAAAESQISAGRRTTGIR
jgi:predicted dehydrogenase